MAKVDAERQKQEDVAAQDEVEAKNRALGLSLERAVLSDRIVAGEKLEQGEDADALAYFDRASRYMPKSSLPEEEALPMVVATEITHSRVTFQGHAGVVSIAVFSPEGRRVLAESN